MLEGETMENENVADTLIKRYFAFITSIAFTLQTLKSAVGTLFMSSSLISSNFNYVIEVDREKEYRHDRATHDSSQELDTAATPQHPPPELFQSTS